ncbi:MAG: hypothetical protein V4519_02730 [Patescibacteria group bacterium]
MYTVHRSKQNPILSPDTTNAHEAYAAFNASPIKIGTRTHILYRAQTTPERFENTNFSLSTIYKAVSTNGADYKNRQVFIEPTEAWERYGCEDPRVTKLGKTYYTFYTALSTFPFGARGIKVAVALSDDLETVREKHLVTPFNAKAMALFPEKINGKYTVILSAHTDEPPSKIAIAQFSKEEDMWSEKFWNTWHDKIDDHLITDLKRKPTDQIEVGSTPIKTKHGWLIIYSHIQNYYSEEKIFGIEAVLLDLKDPQKVIARTKGPLLVPEEHYEIYGTVPKTIFPSGALIEDETLYIFYGATDTTTAVAYVNVDDLLQTMLDHPSKKILRLPSNPILSPTKEKWEDRAVFNPAAIDLDGKIHILYRAWSMDNTSTVGYASSKNGTKIDERLPYPIYTPRESFESKNIPNGNSGCEDARIVEIGDRLYITYTAYNGTDAPAVALSSISTEDFLNHDWEWTKPVLISPEGIDDKDSCIMPFTKNGKNLMIHRIDHNIVASYIDLKNPKRVKEYTPILTPRPGMWDSKKVGLSCPPIKTKQGWLMLYHGISDDGIYRTSALMLDLKDPMIVTARMTDHLFEPIEQYELIGEINNVVFPCGAVVRGDNIFIYYGGADKVSCFAKIKLSEVLKALST